MEKYLSDFHRLVVTVIETTYKKLNPKFIAYRNYKTFSNDSFREEFEQKCQMKIIAMQSLEILFQHAMEFLINMRRRKNDI